MVAEVAAVLADVRAVARRGSQAGAHERVLLQQGGGGGGVVRLGGVVLGGGAAYRRAQQRGHDDVQGQHGRQGPPRVHALQQVAQARGGLAAREQAARAPGARRAHGHGGQARRGGAAGRRGRRGGGGPAGVVRLTPWAG